MNRPLRCLVAWELGANFGHLARCLPLAQRLRSLGHDVLFAVRDCRVAVELLSPQRFPFVQAPVSPERHRAMHPPVNYADMLLRGPCRDARNLQGNMHAWLSLFRLSKPDVLIADHAPTALLAARAAKLPAAVVGDSFDLPPDVSPMPSMRPWEDISADKLRKADAELVRRFNSVLHAHKQPGMQTVSELFNGALKILAGFPELDHYGERPGAHYAGVYYSLESGHTLSWPVDEVISESAKQYSKQDGKESAKLFVYLRPEFGGFDAVLKYLHASSHRVIFVAPGIDPAQAKRFASSRMQITSSPIALANVLAEADLVIGYGSIGFTTQALRLGVPQLMLPPFVEQALYARRVVEMGAGLALNTHRDESACAQAVETLLREQTYRQAAEAFAKRYANYDADAQIDRVVRQTVQRATVGSEPTRLRTAV